MSYLRVENSLLFACAVKFFQYEACAWDISRSKSSPVQSNPDSTVMFTGSQFFHVRLPDVGLGVLILRSCRSLLAKEFCGGKDFFAQGDYFVAVGMNLILNHNYLGIPWVYKPL